MTDLERLYLLDQVPQHDMTKLKALLKARGLSIAAFGRELAGYFGTRYGGTHIYHAVNGYVRPRQVWIDAVATHLDVKPVDVLGPLPEPRKIEVKA